MSIEPLAPLDFSSPPQPAGPGKPGKLVWLALSDLVIDRSYQRDVLKTGKGTIRAILEAFSWAEFDPVVCAPAEGMPGKYAIIDGQHRATAALMHPDIDSVPCWLHEIGRVGQARAFTGVNARVTAMSALQLHAAGVTAGDPDALYVDRVCKRAGVTVCRYPVARQWMKPGETVTIKPIITLLKRDGERHVYRALKMLREAWPELPGAINSLSFHVAYLASQAFAERSPEALAQVLADHDFESLSDQCRPIARAERRPVKALVTERVLAAMTAALGEDQGS